MLSIIKPVTYLTVVLLFLQNFISDGTEELSGNYFYFDEGSHEKDITSHLPGRKNIYSCVIDYDYDSDFILALQEPNYEAHIHMVAFDLRQDLRKYPKNSSEDIEQTEKIADSIIKHDPYYQKIFSHKLNYWIISHKDRQLYGPFTKEEYMQKRKELKVPDDLDL